mgnify:CR=1 FL=1
MHAVHLYLCIIFFKFQATPNRPIVILTVEGTNPSLPSIMLNSHTDVVPVFPVRESFSKSSKIYNMRN